MRAVIKVYSDVKRLTVARKHLALSGFSDLSQRVLRTI